MNIVILSGRLVRDPEYRHGNTNVAKFTIAVDRKYAKNKEADFISCTAFGKTADFISKYFQKGSKINVEGRWQTGSYENKEGQKVYTNDCIIESVEFGESKKTEKKEEDPYTDENPFVGIPDDIEDEVPFGKAE